jgi:hypothetical protein
MQVWQSRIGVASLLFVGLVVVSGGVWLSSPAEAKGQCHSINTTQTAVADFENFTTTGEIKSGFLKGMTNFTGDPLSLTQITSAASPPVVPETFSYTGDLQITTPKGTLTTRSVGVFEGVPLGRGAQFDRVIAGTGLYSGATGFLYFNFEADDTGAAFTSTVNGEVCIN